MKACPPAEVGSTWEPPQLSSSTSYLFRSACLSQRLVVASGNVPVIPDIVLHVSGLFD